MSDYGVRQELDRLRAGRGESEESLDARSDLAQARQIGLSLLLGRPSESTKQLFARQSFYTPSSDAEFPNAASKNEPEERSW